MKLSRSQAIVLLLAVLAAVFGPVCSFGVLAHDLLVLGQDVACIAREGREGRLPPPPIDIEACGVPQAKSGTFHPRAWVYDGVGHALVFETNPELLQAIQLKEAPGARLLRQHTAYAASALLPLALTFIWIVVARRRAAPLAPSR